MFKSIQYIIYGLLLSLSFSPFSIPFCLVFFGIFCKKIFELKNIKLFLLNTCLFAYSFNFLQTYWMPYSIYQNPIIPTFLVPILSFIIPIPFAFFLVLSTYIAKKIHNSFLTFSIGFSFCWVIA